MRHNETEISTWIEAEICGINGCFGDLVSNEEFLNKLKKQFRQKPIGNLFKKGLSITQSDPNEH
ncbi:MAG: hypothetical protein K1000chlam3_00243 [Chlamydiae bacterium]|nr:hypothetical protein [Chlamydiota bacterium]